MNLEIYVISCAVCAWLGCIISSILFDRYLDQLHKEKNKMISRIYTNANEYYKVIYEEKLKELSKEKVRNKNNDERRSNRNS